nr:MULTISPECIES: ArsR family transcriptional regulator [unclassified Streptomyces]
MPGHRCGLAARLGMTSPQVSRHLRKLREAGLVLTHWEGTAVYYRLDTDAIGRLGPDLLVGLLH